MKPVIIIAIISIFIFDIGTFVSAQELSSENQYVGNEEYANLIEKLNQIEETLGTVLENQYVGNEEYANLIEKLNQIEETLGTVLGNQTIWDLPNWTVFALGTAIAIAFFVWQKNKERIRRNSSKRSFVWAMQFIMNNLPHIEQATKDYYSNGEKDSDKQKVEDENSRLLMASAHIRFYLSISADVLDENFVRDVDFLCAVLNRDPILGVLQLDQQRFDTIKRLNNEFLEKELKKEKARLDTEKQKKWKDDIEKITKE